MKRDHLYVVFVVAIAFTSGWLLGNTRAADAAPAREWATDVFDYYATFVGPILTIQDVIDDDIFEAGESLEAVVAARNTILDAVPPDSMLALDQLARYAAVECTETIEYFSGLSEEAANAFLAGMLIEMRDHCKIALRDVRVEVARYAALNGGWPDLPEPTPAPTKAAPVVTVTPTPQAAAPRATPAEGQLVDDLGIPYTLEVMKGVELLSIRTRITAGGLEIVGELENVAGEDSVYRITITGYDADGRVLGTESANPSTYPLPVGERAAFELWTSLSEDELVTYRLQIMH